MLRPLFISAAILLIPSCQTVSQAANTYTQRAPDESFVIETSLDVLAVTHGGQLAIRPEPPGIALLDAAPVARQLALMAQIRDEAGKLVGIASELEIFPENEADKANWQTWWTLVIPGRGALYLRQIETIADEHRSAFEAAYAGQAWRGSAYGRSTVGPAENGHGVIDGGTGDFAGVRGTFVEEQELLEITADRQLKARLFLKLYYTDEPASEDGS
jgi:hypothetical protein